MQALLVHTTITHGDLLYFCFHCIGEIPQPSTVGDGDLNSSEFATGEAVKKRNSGKFATG